MKQKIKFTIGAITLSLIFFLFANYFKELFSKILLTILFVIVLLYIWNKKFANILDRFFLKSKPNKILQFIRFSHF